MAVVSARPVARLAAEVVAVAVAAVAAEAGLRVGMGHLALCKVTGRAPVRLLVLAVGSPVVSVAVVVAAPAAAVIVAA